MVEQYEYRLAYDVIRRMLDDTTMHSRSFIPLMETARELAMKIADNVVKGD